MRRSRQFLFAAALLAAFGAQAADVPESERFESRSQLKSMSVQHWETIATDLANHAIKELGDKVKAGVYVPVPAESTAFDAHLATFLADAFHKAGVKVYSKPDPKALKIEATSSVTVHLSKADMWPPVKGTALATGLVVVRDIAKDSWRAGAVVAGAAMDIINSRKQPSRAELVVSLTVQEDTVYAARQSSIYYVDGADLSLFAGSTLKTIKLEGK